ncbi:hypothetical protein RhiXN_12173 [Rhizoctonia solani]|uniref:DUF6535 domain-containing protein n=1 Tax=Rhizoctonia solani TaxID=456999 RepID=A0A8H8P8Z1_9AGAM|nr:uncharacterized protein RhiXN_12173 [Rhizoctonia solani]QRW26512.1 hypothetical protein RhiXN_12173 [Rhizoctonia solani]
MGNTLLPRQRGTQNVNQSVHEAEENTNPKDIQNDSKLKDSPEGDIGPNAEVWKKYVIETDRADKELVEGWNNSLDVLLSKWQRLIHSDSWLTSTLSSISVSTAFILESTKDLKPDYAEVSAHTLAAVLAALSPTNSDNSSDVPTMDQSNFAPTAAAIQVNILWFTSLSLSVAVALIAIVAKDWCYQFMATRTGPMLIQGRRRQLRWQGIEQWKMQEILNVLPLMMHAALLLFAVGLSLYLWDINPQVALPVVVTTTAVGVFYFVTLLLPLFFRYCPFTTGVMKLFLPYWYTVAEPALLPVLVLFGLLALPFVAAFAVIKRCLKGSPTRGSNRKSEDQKSGLRCWAAQLSFDGCWKDSIKLVGERLGELSDSFMKDRSQLDHQNTPMDDTTSSMLGWMIAQCENVESVDTALQALLCAKPWLPRLPLQTCGALEATLTRLSTDLVAWVNTMYSNGDESKKLRRSVLVQSQCLSMMSQTEEIKQTERCIEAVQVIEDCWDRSEYKEASKELGSLSLHLPINLYRGYERRNQKQRQWELVEKIIRQEVTGLSASDITHLVDGIAKSYLYDPDQSPAPLIKLLDIKASRGDTQLRRMIGVALTIGYVSKHDNGGGGAAPDSASCSKQARKIYIDLTTTRPKYDGWDDSNQLLLYGLLGALLTCSESGDSDDAKAIIDALYNDKYQILRTNNLHEYLKLPQDPIAILSKFIAPGTLSDTHNAPPTIMASSHAADDVTLEIGDALPTAALGLHGESSSHVRMYLDDSNSLKLTICLLSFAQGVSRTYYYRSSSDPWKPAEDTLHSAIDAIIRSDLHIRAYHTIQSHTIQSHTSDLVPHCMSFLWWFAWALLDKCPYYKRSRALDIPSILGQIGAPEGDVPEYVDGMGYTKSWIEKIRLVREQSPQSVLDSQILDGMILHYDVNRERDHGPGTAEASGSEPPTTWLTILRHLKKACEDKVAESGQKVDQGGQEQEAPLAEGAADGLVAESAAAAAPDGEPKDGQDTTQEMRLDCLPPEVLEYAPSDMWLSPVSEPSDQGRMEGVGHE